MNLKEGEYSLATECLLSHEAQGSVIPRAAKQTTQAIIINRLQTQKLNFYTKLKLQANKKILC